MDRSDIDRAARYLVEDCGAKAAAQAEQNLDWAKASGDSDGASNWERILREIVEIQATPRMPSH